MVSNDKGISVGGARESSRHESEGGNECAEPPVDLSDVHTKDVIKCLISAVITLYGYKNTSRSTAGAVAARDFDEPGLFVSFEKSLEDLFLNLDSCRFDIEKLIEHLVEYWDTAQRNCGAVSSEEGAQIFAVRTLVRRTTAAPAEDYRRPLYQEESCGRFGY